MNQGPNQNRQHNDEVDIRELILVLWQGRWLVIGITVLAAVISLVIAFSLPNIYRAEALLAPANAGESGGIDALASQYAGLASLAGVNLGGLGGGADKTVLGIEVLKSRKFIGEFVEHHDILAPLMAADGWDQHANLLIYDEDLYDSENGQWVREVRPPKAPKPSLLEAHKALNSILSVSQDNETGFVRIGLEHYSPYIAKHWIDWLIEDLNAEIKKQEVTEAEQSISYLKKQLEATSLSELQAIFYQLIEDQTKTIMLANVRSEYLFRVVDPAVVVEKAARPKRMLIFVLGALFGVLAGFCIVLIVHFYSAIKCSSRENIQAK